MMGQQIFQYPQMFYSDLACKYGLDVAVFVTGLQQKIFNYAEQKNWDKRIKPEVETLVVNGLIYAPFALKDLQKEFPWWTQKQIQLIKAKAVKANLLHQDCFSANPWDRTAWYAVDLDGG